MLALKRVIISPKSLVPSYENELMANKFSSNSYTTRSCHDQLVKTKHPCKEKKWKKKKTNKQKDKKAKRMGEVERKKV